MFSFTVRLNDLDAAELRAELAENCLTLAMELYGKSSCVKSLHYPVH